MKRFAFPITLAVGIGMGIVLDGRMRPLAAARAGAGTSDLPLPGSPLVVTAGTPEFALEASHGDAQRSAKVRELLAGFDRRKPTESHLKLLRVIIAASPADLADMAKGIGGPWRSHPGWWQIKTALRQRWVEVAPEEAVAWAKAVHKAEGDAEQTTEILAMLATVDPARAMAEALGFTNPMLKRDALRSVIGSLSLTDPQQAFKFAQLLPGDQRQRVYQDLFANWTDRDPSAAAASVLTLKNPSERAQPSCDLVGRWALQDPHRALAWAKGLTDPRLKQWAVESFFENIGRHDPKTGIALISTFPKFQQREYLSGLVNTWMGTDPEVAGAWLMARPDSIEKQQLITIAAGNLEFMPGEKAYQLVNQLTPGSARDDAMKQVVDQWMWSDLDAAVAFTKTLSAKEELKLRETVAQDLAYRDPEKAIAYLKDNPVDDPASDLWARLSAALATKNSPQKALEWASALPDEISRRKALPEIFSEMVREDPVEAARQAAALPDEPTRLECLSTVAGAWAGAGMDDALDWAKGLTGKDGEAAIGAVLEKGAPYQPTAAAQQLNTLMASIPAGTKPADALLHAASAIATAYFAEDEQAAAQWAANLPQDEARAAAIKSLAHQWTQYDPSRAGEWIRTLPSGAPRDAAVGQMVGKIAPSDPASAFAWASTVADNGDRSNLLQTTFASWRTLDATAARSAIQATDWSDAEKSKWLDKVR